MLLYTEPLKPNTDFFEHLAMCPAYILIGSRGMGQSWTQELAERKTLIAKKLQS